MNLYGAQFFKNDFFSFDKSPIFPQKTKMTKSYEPADQLRVDELRLFNDPDALYEIAYDKQLEEAYREFYEAMHKNKVYEQTKDQNNTFKIENLKFSLNSKELSLLIDAISTYEMFRTKKEELTNLKVTFKKVLEDLKEPYIEPCQRRKRAKNKKI